jgi:adenosine deaminase
LTPLEGKPVTSQGSRTFIADLPKAELHLHIEGTLSPETILRLAARNDITLPFSTVEDIEQALDARSTDLEGFLDHHYLVTAVIQTREDLHEITYELLRECRANNIVYVELFFDPQSHAKRGIPFADVIGGIDQGRREGAVDFGVEAGLIMCINRELSVASASEMLDSAEPHRDLILGLGMDSYEEGNPPRKFAEVYARARAEGYRLTAHCDVDQDNSVSNIWECLDLLGVERIDHGVNAIEDPKLVEELKRRGIGLTTCPIRLDASRELEDIERVKQLYELGVLVTINTDDPPEFASGYLSDLLAELQEASGYSNGDLVRFMANAFEVSWLPARSKETYVESLLEYAKARGVTMAPRPGGDSEPGS